MPANKYKNSSIRVPSRNLVLIVCEVKMYKEKNNKNENENEDSSLTKKQSISIKRGVKFIVPMPGSSSWLLQTNHPNGACIPGSGSNDDYTSETTFDHSHHIMNRKFIID